MSSAVTSGKLPPLGSLLTLCANAPRCLVYLQVESLNAQGRVYALLLKPSLYFPSEITLSVRETIPKAS